MFTDNEQLNADSERCVDSLNKSELLQTNFGYLKGRVISKLESLTDGRSIYMVQPAINGLYKKPVRIVTAMFLKLDRVYHFRGYLSTTIHSKRLIPFLSVTHIKKLKNNKSNIVAYNKASESIKAVSFFALKSLTVESVRKVGSGSLYITLSKTIELGNKVNILKLHCISLRDLKKLSSLKQGDILRNIILTMHINSEKGSGHFNEKSLHIVEFNLEDEHYEKLITHISKRFK